MILYWSHGLENGPLKSLVFGSDVDRIIKCTEKLVREYPEGESAWFILAATLKEFLLPASRRYDPDEAKRHPFYPLMIESFDRLVEINPDEPVHRWNRAMLRQGLGLFSEAIEDLQIFVEEVKPGDAFDESDYRSWLASAYDHLGCDLLGIGATEAALGALNKAIKLDPNYRYSWEDLSTVYEILGDGEKAAECLRRADELPEREE